MPGSHARESSPSTARAARSTRLTRGAWLFTLAAGTLAVYRPWAAPGPARYDTDDAALHVAALREHVASAGGPSRWVQVDLPAHPKTSQLDDIDSSPSGYGSTACGPIAAAVALGGDDWPALLAQIVAAAGDHYGAHTGIQPAPFAAALRRVFGRRRVKAVDRATLATLYDALVADRIVIVDLKVNADRLQPSDQAPNYAHFARVLGIDAERGEIFIDNTLHGRPYWTVSLDTFLAAWRAPETSASLILDPAQAESVDRWAVVIERR